MAAEDVGQLASIDTADLLNELAVRRVLEPEVTSRYQPTEDVPEGYEFQRYEWDGGSESMFGLYTLPIDSLGPAMVMPKYRWIRQRTVISRRRFFTHWEDMNDG